MMGLGVSDVRAAARRAAAAMQAAEDELNAADGKLGDGDTGQTMRRVAEAVAKAADASADTDLGGLFRSFAMAGMTATGSSLGTLVSVGLLEIGKSLKGHGTMSSAEFAATLAAAEAAMLSRGNAALGDKTALDVLHAARTQLESDPGNPAAVAAAASAAVAAFRDRPCRIGRARMYADKSIGIDDPGMLAFARLAAAITAS
jgi:dihydroxyacetone kinase-like protein